jgi:hypothetical protein
MFFFGGDQKKDIILFCSKLKTMNPRINITGLNDYSVNEFGEVFSHIKDRWMRPVITGSGYVQYGLTNSITKKMETHLAHRLVAVSFIPKKSPKQKNVIHIDRNRSNNHTSNLKWSTREQLACMHGDYRNQYYSESRPVIARTAQYMANANAKTRRIQLLKDGNTIECGSVVDAADKLHTYRENIYRALKNGSKINGYSII